MKWIVHIPAVCLFLMIVSSTVIRAQGMQQLELGATMVVSPDYRSMMEREYPRYEFSPFTGYGWVGLHAALRLNVTERLSIAPTFGLQLNYVVLIGGGRDETYLNTIILPSLVARYRLDSIPSFYLGTELNYNIPNTGSRYFEFVSGGAGFAGFIGYSFDIGLNLEVGYSRIMIEVASRKENIGGGVFLRIGKALN